MGTTATSLHILSNLVGVGPRLLPDIEKAYRKLGYAKPKKKTDESAAKRVILAPDASGDWLSIYDSDNDRTDTGELKQLAVDVTKKLGTVALLTSVYDSDSFEFVMFHMGKQVDAAVTNPQEHTGGLKMLAGKRRARAWYSAFIGRDLPRAVMSGRQGKLLEGWEERLKRPPRMTTPFAEDELAAWCALAGLSHENAIMVSEDLARREDQAGITTLNLTRAAAKPVKAIAPAGTTLAYYRSDDDCPYHRFYPGAWPRHPGVSDSEQWAIVCSGGFAGLRLRVTIEGSASARLERVHIRALPFYNGQVTSTTAIAEYEWTAPDAGMDGSAEVAIECPGFVVPAADPQSRRQVILLLTVQSALLGEGEVMLTPSLETGDGLRPSPAMPPLRLRAVRPTWVPLVSRSATQDQRRDNAVLRLNTPSVWSATAILPADRGAPRERARALAEGWLARLSPEAGTTAVVQTHKHMSASFNVSKTNRTLPLAELTGDRLWPRLFDEATDYQSVIIGLLRPDTPHPHAGITVQASLRGFARILGGDTVCCAIWQIDDKQVERRIGSSVQTAEAVFTDWIASATPRQAWIARAAWIPEFSTYEDFAQTAYESAVARDWHQPDHPPSMTWLRFVSRRLWLDESFIQAVDAAELEAVAELSRMGPLTAVSLRPGRSLSELEAALAPILPRFRGNPVPG
jgi:hypothetical protein